MIIQIKKGDIRSFFSRINKTKDMTNHPKNEYIPYYDL